jgi:hypothetical protein
MNLFFSLLSFKQIPTNILKRLTDHLLVASILFVSGTWAQSESMQTGAPVLPILPETLQPAQIQPQPVKPMTWGQAFDKHAPLAFFSAGSLAVGGLIVAIRSDRDTPANMRGNLSGGDVAWAMGISGAGAVAAAMAFWYYAHTEVTRDIGATLETDASVEENGVRFALLPTFDGKPGLAAHLALPF